MFKIKILEKVPTADPPNAYELELVFIDGDDRPESFSYYFSLTEESQLFKAIGFLNLYFRYSWNERCGSTIFDLVPHGATFPDVIWKEVRDKRYQNIDVYKRFLMDLNDTWPCHNNGIPYMLESYQVFYYDNNAKKFKTEIIND